MSHSLIYRLTDPPIWYQNIILSLLDEDALGLEADFKPQRHLGAWITFFTIVWILIEVAILAGLLIGLMMYVDTYTNI